MLKKWRVLPAAVVLMMSVLVMVLTAACGDKEEQTMKTGTRDNPDMGAIYSMALDQLMPMDSALNQDMKYLAIDMSNFTDLDHGDKAQILDYFRKYKVKVMARTLDQLGETEPGYMAKGLKGVLLYAESTVMSDGEITVKAVKYRSGTGADFVDVVLTFENGKWSVSSASMTGIS